MISKSSIYAVRALVALAFVILAPSIRSDDADARFGSPSVAPSVSAPTVLAQGRCYNGRCY